MDARVHFVNRPVTAAQCTHAFREGMGRACAITELGQNTEQCENVAVSIVQETSPQCLALASVMDVQDSPSYGDYMCKRPRSIVLTGACAVAGYNPRRRPAPAQPGPGETKSEKTKEDDLQWLPLKRSDLVFLGALAAYGEYKMNKRLGHALKARRAQDAVIKSYACEINPILCSTTEDLKNALAEKGVNDDNVASQLQGHIEEITAKQFRDPDAYYNTFKENVAQDLSHETHQEIIESIKEVAETHNVDGEKLRNAVESMFKQHTETAWRLPDIMP